MALERGWGQWSKGGRNVELSILFVIFFFFALSFFFLFVFLVFLHSDFIAKFLDFLFFGRERERGSEGEKVWVWTISIGTFCTVNP